MKCHHQKCHLPDISLLRSKKGNPSFYLAREALEQLASKIDDKETHVRYDNLFGELQDEYDEVQILIDDLKENADELPTESKSSLNSKECTKEQLVQEIVKKKHIIGQQQMVIETQQANVKRLKEELKDAGKAIKQPKGNKSNDDLQSRLKKCEEEKATQLEELEAINRKVRRLEEELRSEKEKKRDTEPTLTAKQMLSAEAAIEIGFIRGYKKRPRR